MTSRISTLCSGRYKQVIKSLAYHLSGRWSRCTGGRYIDVRPKNLREDHNLVIKDRWSL